MSKTLKAAKEIIDLLDFLIPSQADEIAKKLEVLIKKAEQTTDNQVYLDEIIELLAENPETRSWMEDKLNPDDSEISSRGDDGTSRSDEEDTPYLYPVWFGTNRKPLDDNDLSKGFSNDRAVDINTVHYGRCDVAVPKTHNFGEVGNAWWKRWNLKKFSFDKDDHLTLEKVYVDKNADAFWKICSQTFLENEMTDRDALVFIHGFNNTFEDAAIRSAQIGFDLKIKGYTAFFSWPSKANLKDYSSDESTIIASENAITQFLIDFNKKSGANKIHLIAHSMGNRGLLAALKNIRQKVIAKAENIHFGQIILAAPDLDVDVFKQAKEAYTELSSKTTIYASETDKAVSASRWLHSYPRVGTLPPITVETGIDTIKVNNETKLWELGHGFFAETEALLHDMYDLVRSGTTPNDRQRLYAEETENGEIYWQIKT